MQTVTLYQSPYDPAPGASHRLLRQAAALYAPALADLPLGTEPNGKPYFRSAPHVHFSISHSGALWLCAFSGAPVGLDVQLHRSCRAKALARRFFTPEENAWLRNAGEAAFFDLWCAKESCLKYTGQGLAGLTRLSVVSPDGCFPSAPGVQLRLLPPPAGYSLCLCTGEPAELFVRTL